MSFSRGWVALSPLSCDVQVGKYHLYHLLWDASSPSNLPAEPAVSALIELTLPLQKACSFLATQFMYRFHTRCKGTESAHSGFYFIFSVVLCGSGHLGRTSICQISNIRNISETVLNLHLLSWSCAFSHIVYLLSASLSSTIEKAWRAFSILWSHYLFIYDIHTVWYMHVQSLWNMHTFLCLYEMLSYIWKCLLLSCIQFFATPWTVACQGPPSMEFCRQEYWTGSKFPFPGDLPDPRIEPQSPALQADSLLCIKLPHFSEPWLAVKICTRTHFHMGIKKVGIVGWFISDPSACYMCWSYHRNMERWTHTSQTLRIPELLRIFLTWDQFIKLLWWKWGQLVC